MSRRSELIKANERDAAGLPNACKGLPKTLKMLAQILERWFDSEPGLQISNREARQRRLDFENAS